MIRDMQVDPITRQVAARRLPAHRHDGAASASRCTIELDGIAYGVKTEGGLLDFVTREVEVECLPTAIPQELELDVTELARRPAPRGQGPRRCPTGVTLLDDPDRVIVSVAHAKVEVEAPARRSRSVDGAAEPEVIAKGKKEEEKP